MKDASSRRQHCPVQGTHHLESASQFRSSDACFSSDLQTAVVGALLFQRRRRRQAEISLKESEERMTFTAASVNVGLWQFDRITNEVWATEHCRAMFGCRKMRASRRDTLLEAIHPEDRDTAVAANCGSGMPRNPS